jgi:gliding motility-associated-like protein
MRKIFILILLLSSNFAYSQLRDTVLLCDLSVDKLYWLKQQNGLQYSWEINPSVNFVQRGNSIEVHWLNIGTYVIMGQYTTEYCQGPLSYKIVDVIECPETFAYIPSAFTPNGDGHNDTFGLYGVNILNYRMEIYNRWGELLFVSTDMSVRWEGPNSLEINPSGVYLYKITYQDIQKKHKQLIGRVTLL